MKKLLTVLACCTAMAACKGGENAEDAGASIEDSKAAVTAPQGDQPATETLYNPKSEAGGTLATDGM